MICTKKLFFGVILDGNGVIALASNMQKTTTYAWPRLDVMGEGLSD